MHSSLGIPARGWGFGGDILQLNLQSWSNSSGVDWKLQHEHTAGSMPDRRPRLASPLHIDVLTRKLDASDRKLLDALDLWRQY